MDISQLSSKQSLLMTNLYKFYENTGNIGIFYGSGANQGWDHVMGYIMVAMDKNDTFEWKYKGDPDEGAEWAQCGGYLVG